MREQATHATGHPGVQRNSRHVTAGMPQTIPGVSLSSQLRARPDQYFSYSGRTLLVTGVDGMICGEGAEGFYFENTRLLSRYELHIGAARVMPSGVSPVGGSNVLGYYCNSLDGHIRERVLFVEDARSLGDGMRVRLTISNYAAHKEVAVELALYLAADFADIMEAEEGRREQTGPVETRWDAAREELFFRYQHPQLDRAVSIRIASGDEAPSSTGTPVRWQDGALRFSLALAPHAHQDIMLLVEPIFDGERHPAPPVLFDPSSTPLGRVSAQLRRETPRLLSTNTTVARAWETATNDLATLPLGLNAGPATPMAGLPLYQQFFGRDSLTISWQALLAAPTLLRDTLRANAAWQGTLIDNWRDEEPGKLIHQAGNGPLSALGLTPHSRYYGDYATPPDFLSMLGQYVLWTNDVETVRDLLPTVRQAIDWCERYGDLDGDGFLEYVTRSEDGEKNQGWKDSWDGILNHDGTVVPNPIACCEIQGYWHAALRWSALAFFLAGDRAYALELLARARRLKQRFDRAFWMEDEGFYCMGLDPEKRQIRSIAANAGQLLATGIVPREKGWRVARRLMQPDMFSGWGIRTLSSAHPAYNPFGYHLGSVWPVTQGTFALGFARYGCWHELHQLAEGVFSAAELFADYRLPEVLSGLPRDREHPHPGIYPNSNEPQGWSDSSIVMFVQALLGLIPVAPLHLLTVDPHLPPWLSWLRLEGIPAGSSARVDLEVWRDSKARHAQTRFRVTGHEGDVRVIRQPPPQSPHASLVDRATAALGSLLPL